MKKKWDDRYKNNPLFSSGQKPPGSIEKYCRNGSGRTALDIACGSGRNTIRLCELGWNVVSVDISSEAISLLDKRLLAAGCGDRVKAINDDIANVEFREKSFDLILMSNFYDQKMIEKSSRILKEGGIFIIDTFVSAQNGCTYGMNADLVPQSEKLLDTAGRYFEIREKTPYYGKNRYCDKVPKLSIVATPKRPMP